MSRLRIATGPALAASFVLGFGSTASAQQFLRNTIDIPTSAAATENVDFADVDNDGDWDAVFANGGDLGNQQDVIWINAFNGGDPIGKFTNRTTTQFPAVLDASRDIEFVDFDNDGDHDLYISNTAQIQPNTNRWYANMGGVQAGTIGFFQDQTAARWSGLGTAPSSISPTLLFGGGFLDFSCDCDFGDIDNDGDLDLVHSTYGGAFNGNAPTRIFLNDGAGVYHEFNPSGFMVSGVDITNGSPALWCQGTQQANTSNSTGTNADIASSALDIDLGDIDGDFDLDILHGARQELPRMFKNRLADEGNLAFRDVTGAAFPAGYSTGDGHYEQEMGDQDGDGDLDIYGLNWQVVPGFILHDVVMKNTGNGTYTNVVQLANSSSDDNEGDHIDYDLDGDLDLFIANFGGQERMYRNDGTGTYTFMTGILPSDNNISLDADMCDVDNDGDPDVFVANDGSTSEWYLQNGTANNDVTAPVIPAVEQAPNRAAGASPTVIRAVIRDNAAYYIVWYNLHRLDVTVNGGPVTSYPVHTSQGDMYRGEIPGNLVGTICYQVVSTDKYGNTGTSVQHCYTASGSSTVGTPYCFGDGSGTACPCGNAGAAGNGCASSLFAGGANLAATGVASLSADTLVLNGSSMPNSSALYFQGTTRVAAGAGAAFGDGLRCAGGSIIRLGTKTNVANQSSYPVGGDPSISVRGAVPSAGSVRTYQVWYRNAAAFCTADTFNLANGLEITWGA